MTSPKQSQILARKALFRYYRNHKGQEITVQTIPELIYKLPQKHGIMNEAMLQVLRDLKYDRIIRIKRHVESEQDDVTLFKLRLTKRGQQLLNIVNKNGN